MYRYWDFKCLGCESNFTWVLEIQTQAFMLLEAVLPTEPWAQPQCPFLLATKIIALPPPILALNSGLGKHDRWLRSTTLALFSFYFETVSFNCSCRLQTCDPLALASRVAEITGMNHFCFKLCVYVCMCVCVCRGQRTTLSFILQGHHPPHFQTLP